jgi:hypothetical protein
MAAMSNSDLLSVVGAITGSVGTVSGILGLALAWRSYRRGGRDKALDLRIQLHKELRALGFECGVLQKTIPAALQSRQHVNAAIGLFHSGNMQIFQHQTNLDLERVKTLQEQLLGIDSLADPQDCEAIERRIIEAHGVRAELDQLSARYRAASAEDDTTRDRIARSAESRATAGR